MAGIDQKITSKHVSWNDYKGSRVEEYIKEQLEGKAGCFYQDTNNQRYLVFADAENRDLYLSNPETYRHLLIASFDAPSEYTASIELLTPSYVAILSGTKGQYLRFNFDIVNHLGDSVVDDVYCTYTISRGSEKRTVNARYSYGQTASLNIDNYLFEGTNTISIAITGVNTLAGTTTGVVYKVIVLSLSDNLNIANVYEPSGTLAIPYTVSGTGMKYMEWFLDGAQVTPVPEEDEIPDVESSRTKYIQFENLTSGTHHLQFRVYVKDNEERFYSYILYREFAVHNGVSEAPIICVKGKIEDGQYGLVTQGERIAFDMLTQYIPYDLEFAVYNPLRSVTQTSIKVDNDTPSVLGVENGHPTTFTVTPMTTGEHTITITAGTTSHAFDMEIAETTMDIHEITDNLVLDFNATGRTNEGSHDWSYGDYHGTFTGFAWNGTSGWVDGKLLINDGASFGIDYAPFLENAKTTGLTIEIEYATTNVSNDDVVILDLLTNLVGLKLTASEASLASNIWKTSANPEDRALSTKFKSGEVIRVAYVINPYSGVDNHGLVFIYINGRCSGAKAYTATDNFDSSMQILFEGSADAAVELRQLRIYRTALSAANILNNYILYRPTLNEMMGLYDANDVLLEGSTSFDMDKLAQAMPIIKFTGNIPALENEYQDKKKQIIVDVEYVNMQDPTKSFTMTNATLTPQGTSSMAYPKKNFRLYTRKYSHAVLKDYEGNVVEDGLYAFKDGAQRVACWCFKTDYAESSSSHNTGVARLWNKCLYDAKVSFNATDPAHSVSNEYALRTNAQKAALENDYEYDVRTCVDGFPVMAFYRLTEDSNYIFIGKYNFNNDKSTESVFGFCDIPGFDDSNMECWEVTDNSHALSNFQNVTDFDTKYSEAFESRYPDDAGDPSEALRAKGALKIFCTWLSAYVGEEGSEDFAEEKWDHLDVYKVAAYYVYMMVFGAVDQTTKNAMFTTEDGEHFYYINYDNDTIFGVRNDGRLVFGPDIDRQSLDPTADPSQNVYAYAGHENTLWNMLEADDEFMAMVKSVYESLYSVGMNYATMIDMFDNKQSLKWCERVFNQDADYKYLSPYRAAGTDNLTMLQGARSAHRRWWISKRLALYDSLFVAGEFKTNIFNFKCVNGTPSGLVFSFTAGMKLYYGFGIQTDIYKSGILLDPADPDNRTHVEILDRGLAIGDPISIYAGQYLKEVDISGFLPYLNTIDMTTVLSIATGVTSLKKLVIGNNSGTNTLLTTISGLASGKKLEYLDVRGCAGLTSLNITQNPYISTLLAQRSHINAIEFAPGSMISTLGLPTTITSLILEGCADLESSGITFEDTYGKNINAIFIRNCASLAGAWSLWNGWFAHKNASSDDCSFYADGIDWTGVGVTDLIAFGAIGDLTLKGKILLSGSISPEQVAALRSLFGDDCFNQDAELWIRTEQDYIALIGPDSLTEGESATYELVVITSKTGYVKYSVSAAGTHAAQIGEDTGVLVTTETGSAADTVIIFGRFFYGDGQLMQESKTVSILKATYPGISAVSIEGDDLITSATTSYRRIITGEYTGHTTGEWTLTGDLAEYATVSGGNDACVVTVQNLPSIVFAAGTLSYTLYKTIGGVVTTIGTVTKTITVVSDQIAVARAINGPIMTALWNAYGTNGSQVASRGQKIAHQDYVSKAEAATFVGADFNPSGGQTGSIFYAQRNNITNFDEFKYFTGVTAVPAYCFFQCQKMASFGFHNYITSIGAYAFAGNTTDTYYATLLKDIDINLPSVTTLGTGAFCGAAIKTITLPLLTGSLPEKVFNRCDNLRGIYLESLTGWSNGINITPQNECEFYLPNLISSPSDSYYMFGQYTYPSIPIHVTVGNCTSLSSRFWWRVPQGSSLTISKNATSVPVKIRYSYQNNFPFTSVNVEEGNTSFVKVGDCVKQISNNELVLCPNIPEPVIDSSITSIGERAMSNHSKITTLSIPSSVTSFGASAFAESTGVKNLSLDVTFAPPTTAFTSFTALESLHLGPHFTTGIGAVAQSLNHNGHNTITSLTVDEDNTEFINEGNAIVGSTSHELFIGCNTSVIPSSVTSIGSYAFAYCKQIESLDLSGISNIKASAFDNCGVKSVTFSNNVTFGASAMAHSGLTSVVIPGSATFGNYAFDGCGSLKSIDISSSVSNIGTWTFRDCLNVDTIIIRRMAAPNGNTTFTGNGASRTAGYNNRNLGINKLYVPSGATGYDSSTSYNVYPPLFNDSNFTLEYLDV